MKGITHARFLWAKHGSDNHLSANIPLIRTQLHGQNLTVKVPGKRTLLLAQEKEDMTETGEGL